MLVCLKHIKDILIIMIIMAVKECIQYIKWFHKDVEYPAEMPANETGETPLRTANCWSVRPYAARWGLVYFAMSTSAGPASNICFLPSPCQFEPAGKRVGRDQGDPRIIKGKYPGK